MYWGGGTPSLLHIHQIEAVLNDLHEAGLLSQVEECTLELNPEHATREYLNTLRSIGIDRLSIGIQSFDDQMLHALNRSHTSYKAVEAVSLALDAGFTNLSLDLMFALPGQSLDDLKKEVKHALQLGTTHISLYQLTIEDQTFFGRQLVRGKLSHAEETLQASMLEYLIDTLEDAGFEQYEISNFAKPGYRSVHNTAYWTGSPYRGFGPGAHSFDGGYVRSYNSTSIGSYIQKTLGGIRPFTEETLTPVQRMNEAMMTALRTKEGFMFRFWEEKLEAGWFSHHAKKLNKWHEIRCLEVLEDRVVLLKKGKLIADHITLDLMI